MDRNLQTWRNLRTVQAGHHGSRAVVHCSWTTAVHKKNFVSNYLLNGMPEIKDLDVCIFVVDS
jgi:hypothetical protein